MRLLNVEALSCFLPHLFRSSQRLIADHCPKVVHPGHKKPPPVFPALVPQHLPIRFRGPGRAGTAFTALPPLTPSSQGARASILQPLLFSAKARSSPARTAQAPLFLKKLN